MATSDCDFSPIKKSTSAAVLSTTSFRKSKADAPDRRASDGRAESCKMPNVSRNVLRESMKVL